MSRKKKLTQPGLMDVVLGGLTPKSTSARRHVYKKFAEFRRADSAEAALHALIEMNLGQVKAVLAEYRAHLIEHNHSQPSVVERVSTIRTAIRKARAAGLTTLNLDGPSKEYAPGSLMNILFNGLTPLTVRALRHVYKKFAEFRRADSAEAALHALIEMNLGQVKAVLAEFKAYLIEHNHSQPTAAERVSMIRTAVRKARKAGFTLLDVGHNPPDEYEPTSLIGAILGGMKPESTRFLRQLYKKFAEFRRADSAEAALHALIEMDLGQVKAVLAEYRAHLIEQRKLSQATVRTYVSAIRTAMRKARAAGYAAPNLEGPSREYEPGSLMSTVLDGLTPLTADGRLLVYKKFAAFRDATSAEAALQALIQMDLGQVQTVLDGYRAHLIEQRGLSQAAATINVGMIRIAVRKARAAGLTTLNLDGPKQTRSHRRKAVAKSRRPKSRNAERDDFFIRQKEEGVSCGEIARQFKAKTGLLMTPEGVRKAIERRKKSTRTQ
jgi:hypothetical protein